MPLSAEALEFLARPATILPPFLPFFLPAFFTAFFHTDKRVFHVAPAWHGMLAATSPSPAHRFRLPGKTKDGLRARATVNTYYLIEKEVACEPSHSRGIENPAVGRSKFEHSSAQIVMLRSKSRRELVLVSGPPRDVVAYICQSIPVSEETIRGSRDRRKSYLPC